MKQHHLLTEDFKPIDDEDYLKELVFTKFSQALENAKKGKVIVRGDQSLKSYVSYYATPLKTRKAAFATLNIHNEYINNDPRWSEYPNRYNIFLSKHIDLDSIRPSPLTSSHFIFPINNSNIGVCPSFDIWDSFTKITKLFGIDRPMFLDTFFRFLATFFNKTYGITLKINDTYSEFKNKCKEFDRLLKSGQANVRDMFSMFKDSNSVFAANSKPFIELLFKQGMEKTMDELFSTDGFRLIKPNGDFENKREVWSDDDYLALTYDDFISVIHAK